MKRFVEMGAEVYSGNYANAITQEEINTLYRDRLMDGTYSFTDFGVTSLADLVNLAKRYKLSDEEIENLVVRDLRKALNAAH